VRLSFLILATTLAGACVPKAKYDQALGDQERLYDRIDGMTEAMNDVSREIERVNSELKIAESALEDSNRRLATKIAEAGQLQRDIEQMKEALRDLERRKAQADASLEAYRQLLIRFQSLIDAGTLRVRVVDGRMVVELATDILFSAGSANLSSTGKEAIKQVSQVLASIEERQYQVAGHTDNMPIATAQFPTNWHLGAARAISVTKVLIDSGLPAERVSAASFGDTKPVDTNRTPEGKEANRRIEITIVPDLSTLPGYEELQTIADGKDPAEESEETGEGTDRGEGEE
jgi:chemotaxis protein MotB